MGRMLERLDDRSISAACLFAFAPAMLFRHASSQIAFSYEFVFILFFILFHTTAIFLIAYKAFQFLDVSPRIHRLFLLTTVIISIFGLRRIQPLLGGPEAVQTVNMIIFYHMLVVAVLGFYLSRDDRKDSGGISMVLCSPFIYALGAGLIFAVSKIEMPYLVLESIDSLHNVTIPLSLLLLGVVLGKYVFLVEMVDYAVLIPGLAIVIFFRMILSPALAMLLAPRVIMENVELQRALIYSSGVPTGLFAVALVCFYGKQNEKRFVALCVVLSTVVHYVTLPILTFLINRWFPVEG